MFGDRFSSSTNCSRWLHETEPGRPNQSFSCCFLKVATHPFKKIDLLRFGGKPVRPRMFQDKIKRQEPPHQNRVPGLPPMPDILDTERPVDRHVRNPAQSSATGKHHRIPFDARPPRHQCPDNPESLFSIRVEVVTELRPDKNPAMETDKRDPFRFPARPAKRFQCSLSPAQVLDHGSPNVVPFPLASILPDRSSPSRVLLGIGH